jgi:hypothetical protein
MAIKRDAELIACEPSGGDFGCHHFLVVHGFLFVSWRDLPLGLALLCYVSLFVRCCLFVPMSQVPRSRVSCGEITRGWGVMSRMRNPLLKRKDPAVGPGQTNRFALSKRIVARVGAVLLSVALRELFRWLLNVMRD